MDRDVALESKDIFCLLVLLIQSQPVETVVKLTQSFLFFLYSSRKSFLKLNRLDCRLIKCTGIYLNDTAREIYRQHRDLQCMLTHATKLTGTHSVKQINKYTFKPLNCRNYFSFLFLNPSPGGHCM